MKALILNSGSSSLKFGLFEAEGEHLLAGGGIDWSKEPTHLVVDRPDQPRVTKELNLRGHADAVGCILDELHAGEINAVGHRVVDGGEQYTSAVRITSTVKAALAKLAELAPLHNKASLAVIGAAMNLLPDVDHIAAFDTAFHATLSEAARTYAIPHQWTADWHLRRFGFHGLSYAYSARRAAAMLPGRELRLVVAHLGNGASVSAIRNGVSVDTSMGFTPLDGLMMGTRSGSVDPGILIYLMRHKGLDADRLDHALNYQSGLLGVSGISADMREVLAACDQNPRARLAVDVFVHRLIKTIAAMAATLGGLDALVFTAGIGEHSPEIRRLVCKNLAFLGIELDEIANDACRPDADIATRASKGRILVITAREDLTILREVRRLIGSQESA
jgi:acetate kinase